MATHVDAINAGVGEFVAEAGSAMKLNIVITRGGDEKDFAGSGVDDGNDIDVGAGAGVLDGRARVGARNVDNDRRGAKVDFFFFKFWSIYDFKSKRNKNFF